jgi:RND family efflux transporter MFP subunit
MQSPELDRQYEAARADASIRRANARRAANLAEPGVVSVREAEVEKAGADMATATLAALATQRGYTILRAPFAGTVTARYVDVGALVQNAANGQSGAQPVVTVSELDRLRVFVYVDQQYAPLVRAGDGADIVVIPGAAPVRGRISRVSGELEAKTRTMLVEVHLDNKDRAIVPGSFVAVHLTVKSPALIEVPVEALLLRDQKPFVAVVAPDHRVNLRGVTVAYHDGARIGVSAGLQEGETVALNLGRSAQSGDLIQPVGQPAAPAPTAGSTNAPAHR